MMNRSLTLFAFTLASVCALGAAFAPVSSRSFQPARVVAAANNRLSNKQVFRMSEEPTETEVGSTEVAPPKVDADGSFYDDEYEPAEKIGISDSMRDRLKREASTGMDSEKKQSNVILYIGAAIAVLVALGGQGILY